MYNFKSRYPSRLWLPGLFLLCVIWLHSAPGHGADLEVTPQLVVSHFSTGKEILSLKVTPGDKFTIRYIHSVDKTPIFEEFRIDREKGLVLEKTWFKMFGAGLGHWPGHGDLSQNSEWITIDNIEQPLGSFILRIGSPSVGHTIIYHEQKVYLSRIAPGVRALVEFRK
ncbi:MAG: hypothetical protein DRH03_03525 [Deltaproteobacteria bacterium]|nr:MAG: hypothetical protein DRH03_03525 [Deltaproteobacteria bacterium]